LTRTPDIPTLNWLASIVGGEGRRTVRGLVAVTAFACLLSGLPAVGLQARQQTAAAPPATASATPAAIDQASAAHAAPPEGEHAESPWALVARLFNFAILAGALGYLLRSPLMRYLEERGVAVRSELTKAAGLRTEAGAQLAEIDAKMKALPGEIEALKRRGAEEIVAEEARIRTLAESERRRLLDQAKREIETALRMAERDLKKRAGELAVEIATERVRRTITDRDQATLVDRYVAQVRQ
jgi:F0F1-type ATP synthase membrane subunit b/b'